MKFQKEYEKELLMKKNVQASFSCHIFRHLVDILIDGDPTGDGNYVLLGLGSNHSHLFMEKERLSAE